MIRPGMLVTWGESGAASRVVEQLGSRFWVAVAGSPESGGVPTLRLIDVSAARPMSEGRFVVCGTCGGRARVECPSEETGDDGVCVHCRGTTWLTCPACGPSTHPDAAPGVRFEPATPPKVEEF